MTPMLHASVRVRLIVGLFVALTEVVFIWRMHGYGVEFVFSGLLVTAALLLQLTFAVRRDSATPADIIVFLFNWLFLDFAPKVQLMDSPWKLINTSTLSLHGLLMTNLMCALFIAAYTASYPWIRRRWQVKEDSPGASLRPERQPFSGGAVLVSTLLCALIVLTVGPYIYHMSESMAYGTGSNSSPIELIGAKYFLFLPSATMMLLINETAADHKSWKFTRICALLVLAVLVLYTQSPPRESRGALGPVYLTLIMTALAPILQTQNRRMILLILGMVLVFPIAALFTHGIEFTWDNVVDTIRNHYFDLHYDAWANTYTAIEMATRNGIEWGHQLAGALLFFVPSSIWATKASATGVAIGKYLMVNYRMWFTNLSAPLVGEGYIDFGVAGVALYGALLPFLVVALNNAARRNSSWMSRPMAFYYAVFLMFALRGSLMVAVAYGTGALMAFVTASFLLSRRLGSGRALARASRPWLNVDLPGNRLPGSASPAGSARRQGS
jgi:hypothetical protein